MSFDEQRAGSGKQVPEHDDAQAQLSAPNAPSYMNPNTYDQLPDEQQHKPIPLLGDDQQDFPDQDREESKTGKVLTWIGKTMITIAILGFVYAAGWFSNQWYTTQAFINNDAAAYLRLYQEAFSQIESKYVDRDAIDYKKMTYAAIDAMVKSLNDGGHTRFLTPEEVARENQSLSGKTIGIGVYLNQDPTTKKLIVTAPVPDSPAEKAGIKAGDQIIAVNGVDIVGKEQSEVAGLIQGKEGTEVTITILRNGETLNFKIIRAQLKSQIVQYYMIPGTTTGHISISQFADGAGRDLRAAVTDLKKQGANKFILDLRNNPGGYLREAQDVASVFLQDGIVLISQDRNGQQEKTMTLKNAVDTTSELVVLTNKNSASASEIVSAALRDSGRAKIIGETTYGTGTVLQPVELSDGSEILMGVEQWLTPKGDYIRGQGVKPDIIVESSKTMIQPFQEKTQNLTLPQLQQSGDPILIKALEVLGTK